MKAIETEAKTLKHWEEILLPTEIEALHDFKHMDPIEVLTPNEVLDIIIQWNGGIASGYHVLNIISRVYGVLLCGY